MEEDLEARMISSNCFSVSSFATFILIAVMTASTVISVNSKKRKSGKMSTELSTELSTEHRTEDFLFFPDNNNNNNNNNNDNNNNDNNNNININNFNEMMARSIDQHSFWPLIFGLDKIDGGTFKPEASIGSLSCSSKESFLDILKDVNDQVLAEISHVLKQNPGCMLRVRCEAANYMPKYITKLIL